MIVHTSQGKFDTPARQKNVTITSSSKTYLLYKLIQEQDITHEGELSADIKNILMEKVGRNNFKLSFRDFSKLSNVTVLSKGRGNDIDPKSCLVLLVGQLSPPGKTVGQYLTHIPRESMFICTLKNIILKVNDDHLEIRISKETSWES